MEQEQGLQVLNKENIEIIGTASKVLLRNRTSVQNANEYGDKILSALTMRPMDDKLDEACNKYLVQLAKTEKAMKDRRSPITGIFDMVRSEFTSLEKQVSKSGEMYQIIQQKRNEYAKAKAKAERKRQEAAQLKLNQENERVEIVSKVKVNIEATYNNYATNFENEMYGKFHCATLENFDSEIKWFDVETSKMTLSADVFKTASSIRAMYLEQTEAEQLIAKTKADILPNYEKRFFKLIDEIRIDILEKAPGRKQELQEFAEMEKKNKAEAAKLKKQQEEREAKEKHEREAKSAQAKVEAQAKLDAEKEASKMNNLFNATSEAAVSETKSQVRKSLKIVVSHQSAWVEIFTFYMQTEGMKLGIDELGKKSLNQMKAFCEKHATKTGELIQSKYIKYEEDFKAVNKA